jgi:hypothetical protein
MAATHKENTSLLQNRGASMVISPEKREEERDTAKRTWIRNKNGVPV